jgi:hypothetical protein
MTDGLIYLPEIKYRRIMNKAFGPGGWGLAPRSETSVGPKLVSREYALVCNGRSVGSIFHLRMPLTKGYTGWFLSPAANKIISTPLASPQQLKDAKAML